MRGPRTALALGLLGLGCTAVPAAAKVLAVAANGMEVRHQVRVAAPAEKVWAALVVPARWWNSDHSFSGSAANITIDARVGGCWCETLPNGGGVTHMVVSYVAPPRMIVFRGALGPFYNQAADGALAISLAEKDGATDVTWTFRVGGYVKDGFKKSAKAVDEVLGQQIGNLKTHLEPAR